MPHTQHCTDNHSVSMYLAASPSPSSRPNQFVQHVKSAAWQRHRYSQRESPSVMSNIWEMSLQLSPAKFWEELSSISWCPVMQEPPAQGLPWQSQVQAVASPRVVRPLRDMWRISATLAILDGESRQAASLIALQSDACARLCAIFSASLCIACYLIESPSLIGAPEVASEDQGQKAERYKLCRSKAMEQGLGWSEAVPASIIASQLVALGALNEVCYNGEVSQVCASKKRS